MRYKITKYIQDTFIKSIVKIVYFSLTFLLENAFCQLNPSIARLISSTFALCNARPLDNIVEDDKFTSQILHKLADNDSLDVETGGHLIQLLNLAVM